MHGIGTKKKVYRQFIKHWYYTYDHYPVISNIYATFNMFNENKHVTGTLQFFSDIISRRKMLDICVTILCGIPGSGKSTFAKSLIDKSTVASQGYWEESKSLHWLLVSYDEIIPTDVEKNIIEKEVLFF